MNIDRPIVSVIVPTRNSARTLEACLTSIRAQAYEPIEIIVVDNNSNDATLSIAHRYADVVTSLGPERSAQRNGGARVARGAFLLFIDSDMALAPGVVGECLDVIRASRAPGVIIPELSTGVGFLAECRALERSCYVGDDSVEAARFFSLKAFEDSGGFDESLTGPEDWDLTRRISAGRRLPRTVSYISHDEGQLRFSTVFAKKRYYAESSILYMRKHGRSSLSQGNLLFRPAFLRNWRRFLRHPILAFGVLSLKTVEAASVTVGVVETLTGHSRSASHPIAR
jgi:glycosyltransferase involved in cell wall biosynthesis